MPSTTSLPLDIADADAISALFAPIARLPVETAAFAYLDPDQRLLALRHAPSRRQGRATISTRAILTDAVAFNASAVVMAHNHPSGDPTPSEADVTLTRSLNDVLEAIGVKLLDHFILASDAITSLRALGLL